MLKSERKRPRPEEVPHRDAHASALWVIRDSASPMSARRGTPVKRDVDAAVEAMWDNVPI